MLEINDISFIKVIKFLGDNSPKIFLVITSIYLFYNFYNFDKNNNNYVLIVIFYLIGYFLNNILNIQLKLFNKKNTNLSQGNNMPSGHFQSMSYSFIFAFYALIYNDKCKLLFIIYSLIALCTFYNCLAYQYHTTIDMITGIITGGIFGYLYYNKIIKYVLH